MSEELQIDKNSSREEKYKSLVPQIQALLTGESDMIANMANISAALKEVFSFWWVGFYLVKNNELVLGPFQGPVACTRIALGKGVCGTSWKEAKTIIVADVDQFPGHIACSSASRSEIVVPVLKDGKVIAVLDVDSEHYDHFDKTDDQYLTIITKLLS
ncbi:MAG: GAF domain-containing protein [Sphingobacteriales bacterium]|jgi:GAF domain-containing protein|nr:GAF domain-containing protein [Sphingobacteriales bacterium]